MKNFLLAALLAVAAVGYEAPAVELPENINTVLRSAYSPEKRAAVRSLKLIFGVSGSGIKGAILVVRAETGKKLRVDSVAPEGIYTACRNGDEFWGFDGKHGSVMLGKEDIRAMQYDLAFLPVPFDNPEIYAPLSFTGSVDVDTCGFKTAARDGGAPKLVVLLNKKTGLFDRIEREDADGVSVISFRDYQDFDGAKLATRILCSSPEGAITLRLRAIDWNPQFPEGTFVRKETGKDADLLLLQKGIAAVTAKAPAPAPAPKKVLTPEEVQAKEKARAEKAAEQRKKRIAYCHQQLRNVDMQISEKEERRTKCEAFFQQTRRDAINTAERASEKTYVYRSSWSYRGWGNVRPHRVSSGNSAQRKLAKELYQDSDAALREYEKLSKELINLRLKRSEVLAELEKLDAK